MRSTRLGKIARNAELAHNCVGDCTLGLCILPRYHIAKPLGDHFRECHRNGIPKLSHTLGPRTLEHPVIGKGLQACAFAYREVADGTVLKP